MATSQDDGEVSCDDALTYINISLETLIELMEEMKQSNFTKKEDIPIVFAEMNGYLIDLGNEVENNYGEEEARIAKENLSSLEKIIHSISTKIKEVIEENEQIFRKYCEWLLDLQELIKPFTTPVDTEAPWTGSDYNRLINDLHQSSEKFMKFLDNPLICYDGTFNLVISLYCILM